MIPFFVALPGEYIPIPHLGGPPFSPLNMGLKVDPKRLALKLRMTFTGVGTFVRMSFFKPSKMGPRLILRGSGGYLEYTLSKYLS